MTPHHTKEGTYSFTSSLRGRNWEFRSLFTSIALSKKKFLSITGSVVARLVASSVWADHFTFMYKPHARAMTVPPWASTRHRIMRCESNGLPARKA